MLAMAQNSHKAGSIWTRSVADGGCYYLRMSRLTPILALIPALLWLPAAAQVPGMAVRDAGSYQGLESDA
ncbi:hypothetical protein ABL840_18890 [Variovorax sp. NFACC27]|jgi:hypothetical protein|uniref:hypothetical protein n=1 Tax=unclassified Variovorax TaxID=663243 RepID=UPI000B820DDB